MASRPRRASRVEVLTIDFLPARVPADGSPSLERPVEHWPISSFMSLVSVFDSFRARPPHVPTQERRRGPFGSTFFPVLALLQNSQSPLSTSPHIVRQAGKQKSNNGA